jgi:hypothetical protein
MEQFPGRMRDWTFDVMKEMVINFIDVSEHHVKGPWSWS